MKRIAALIISSLMLLMLGCMTTDDNQRTETNHNTFGSIVVLKAFNDEVYVWENFNFTTNRVIDKR